MRELIFKNDEIDIRPYFLHTTHQGSEVTVNVSLLGFSQEKIGQIIKTITPRQKSHLGGVDAKIVSLRLIENDLRPYTISDNRVVIKFITPTALYRGETLLLVPELKDVVEFLVRSVNRYSKYYLKEYYPYHIADELKNINAAIGKFEMDTFEWKHKSTNGRTIELNGIWGGITYTDIDNVDGLGELLGLSRFFQLGKYTSYGFGKIEVK